MGASSALAVWIDIPFATAAATLPSAVDRTQVTAYLPAQTRVWVGAGRVLTLAWVLKAIAVRGRVVAKDVTILSIVPTSEND